MGPMDARGRILHAAAKVFSEVGFRGATTRRIAQEADVNEITLFRHFGSKEQLLLQACAVADLQATPPILPQEPKRPRAELRAWARRQMAQLLERRSFIRTCMAEVEEHPEMLPPGNQTVRTAAELTVYLRRLQERGLARAPFDPAVAAPLLMGVLFADAMARDVMPGLFPDDPDSCLDQYIDLFLRGIGAGRARRRKRETAS